MCHDALLTFCEAAVASKGHFHTDLTGSVDPKIARGLARNLGSCYAHNSSAVRKITLDFAIRLMAENYYGQKRIDPAWFNVAMAQALNAAKSNPATLYIEQERMRLPRNGHMQVRSIRRSKSLHISDGEYETEDWVVSVDDLRVNKGYFNGRFWTAKALIDHHVLIRYMERGHVRDLPTVSRLIDDAVLLCGLYDVFAIIRPGQERGEVHLCDVVIPAPGGAICGGIEVLAAPAFRDALELGYPEDTSALEPGLQFYFQSRRG
jgi:hypothetical protein